MDKEIKAKYIDAGKINKKVLDFAGEYIKEGRSLLDIAETLEKKIDFYSDGRAKAAWPVNLSINENAAHQTASLEEEIILTGKELLKVDVGVHIDGYISDAAITIDLSGEQGKMVEAAEGALEKGIEAFEKTKDLAEIGKAVGKEIKDKGFNVVENLTGHFLEQWENHAAPSIPNVEVSYSMVVEEECVIAIEPFATDGKGFVKEGAKAEIFAFDGLRPLRNMNARKLLEIISEKYKTLPFAERWISKEVQMNEFHRKVAFKDLVKAGCLRAYPTLHEEKGKFVAQAETTLLVEEEGITRLV